jgi:hypothetical protein
MGRRGPISGSQCSICRHEQRHRIELSLVSGVSHRAVAAKFEVSPHAVRRHGENHVSPERRAQLVAGPLKLQQLAERAADEGMSMLDYVAMLRSTLMERFLAASECDDRPGTALLAGRLTELLRLQASLTGELSRAGATITNNTLILSSPLMADLQAMLAQRLRPYPDAMRAVLEGLEDLSTRALNGATAPLHAPQTICLPSSAVEVSTHD